MLGSLHLYSKTCLELAPSVLFRASELCPLRLESVIQSSAFCTQGFEHYIYAVLYLGD